LRAGGGAIEVSLSSRFLRPMAKGEWRFGAGIELFEQ
jgi:hypothetical protein